MNQVGPGPFATHRPEHRLAYQYLCQSGPHRVAHDLARVQVLDSCHAQPPLIGRDIRDVSYPRGVLPRGKRAAQCGAEG